jgi:DNA repair protein RadC
MPPLEKPHYLGHRARLKQRFLQAPQALPDYEILELFLGWLYPRRDTKPLAKDLLEAQGSLWSVFHTTQDTPFHVGFACVVEICRRLLLKDLSQGPLLNTLDKVVAYCHLTMACLPQETFRLFFLNKKFFLIKEEVCQTGTLDEFPLYPRQVMARARALNAAHLILVHNHPSGDPTPSKADMAITTSLEKILAPFQVRVLDHLIIGRQASFSFREHGLLGQA